MPHNGAQIWLIPFPRLCNQGLVQVFRSNFYPGRVDLAFQDLRYLLGKQPTNTTLFGRAALFHGRRRQTCPPVNKFPTSWLPNGFDFFKTNAVNCVLNWAPCHKTEYLLVTMVYFHHDLKDTIKKKKTVERF